MSIKYKDDVLHAVHRDSGMFVCVDDAILIARLECEAIFTRYGADLIVTSCLDGVHGYRSLHHFGLADDWRSHHLPSREDKRLVLEEIQQELGPDFDVVLEGLGTDNEHYHVEFDPKGAR